LLRPIAARSLIASAVGSCGADGGWFGHAAVQSVPNHNHRSSAAPVVLSKPAGHRCGKVGLVRSFDSILESLPAGSSDLTRPPLAQQMTTITPSVTGEVDAWVKELGATGSPVVALTAGEPILSTPEHIVEAAAAACRSERLHRYTPSAGLLELREAIAAKTARDSGFEVTSDAVVVTSGVRQALGDALVAILDPGDEVLLPAPYWPTYRVAVLLAGGRAVTVPAAMANDFKVTVDQLESAISHRTKALLLCSPCNPTGAVYSPQELRGIVEWAADEDLWVITDEIYEHVVYGSAVASSPPAVVPAASDRCIVLNSVSKAYAMTGWRVGWLIGPSRVVGAVSALQSHATSHASNVAQAAALAALEGGLASVEAMTADLDRRRLRLCAFLAELTGAEVVEPSGAFYAFPSVEAWLGGSLAGRAIRTTLELSSALLEHSGVAVLPGEVFGRVGHLRISFALPDEALEEGIARLTQGFAEITRPSR
jgi:aspartate aminotransferase